MLRLNSKAYGTTPPDKFSYKFKEDGVTKEANDITDWLAKIKKHAEDNGYPIPSREEVEDQLCRRLSGEWCTGGTPHSFINTRFTLDDFLRGTKALGSFALSTDEVVSPEVAEQRAIICSRCVANVSVPGCTSCVGLANIVAAAKGAKKTKYDHLLKSCAICSCSNEAAVWIPMKFLAKSITPDHEKTYETIEECWKTPELKQFRIDNGEK